MKRRKPIKRRSDKKVLRDKIGAIHFKILKLERGDICEISGRFGNGLGRFHILPVGQYPQLEYNSWNILIVNWHPYHEAWHHCNSENPIWQECKRGIIRRRGENYETELKAMAKMQPKHSIVYLQTLLMAFKQELERLEN